MTETSVQRDGGDGVVRLGLNRPTRGNSLNPETVELLLQELEQASGNGTRLLVLSGAGKSFCTGFDLSDLEGLSDGDLLWRFVRIEMVLQRLYYAPFVTLALAQGNAFGAGADLFCACQHRVAAPDARFSFPGVRFGLLLGTRRLAARVGSDAARSILTSAAPLDAEAAQRYGLSSRVAAPETWGSVRAEIERSAQTLEPSTTARIHAATRPDTRKEDMADLVASACEPGLRGRILSYRKSVRGS